MGFILFIVALIVVPILSIVGIIYGLISIFVKGVSGMLSQVNKTFYFLAHTLDRFGNVACEVPLTHLMIKKGADKVDYWHFGDNDETVSAVIGANKVLGTLSGSGLWWCNSLNKIDPLHCELAFLSEICKVKMNAKSLREKLNSNPNFLIHCLNNNIEASDINKY